MATDQRQADAGASGQMCILLNWAHKSLAFIPPAPLGTPGYEKNPKYGTEVEAYWQQQYGTHTPDVISPSEDVEEGGRKGNKVPNSLHESVSISKTPCQP
ncbi:unnamed protein product [Bubo scandiacus]